MADSGTLRKTKLTITISGDVINEIDEIAKKKGTPRSRVMEEMLRNGVLASRRMAIEREVEAYYASLTEEERGEDKEWCGAAAESAGRIWRD